ncbi:phosphoribosyl-AMP cyclohydrolase [Porphyrobacter sp. TH134]|uniref:phosphoribosyl-AMP cyclohydrolase n=1 Tax=Porphyrobacter sp. TH134 TaxID=2067450 RepID=UPI001F3C6935|nr:phosphoribosyl-AMP cyclohydrolase [Porphyrobacter sp. TH134]
MTLLATAAVALITACTPGYAEAKSRKPAATPVAAEATADCITEKEVVAAQKAWGDGIVNIGKVYSSGGDYTVAAAAHIDQFYAYDLSLVLFKPTLASVDQFRTSFDSALSYFVGGNPTYPEDKGFAIKPWSKVRWKNVGITNNSCTMAVAMGNYWFTAAGAAEETKVEYTFGYIRDPKGALKIVVHQSSVPYNGA